MNRRGDGYQAAEASGGLPRAPRGPAPGAAARDGRQPAQIRPVSEELIAQWQDKLFEALVQVNRAIGSWHRAKTDALHRTSGLDEYNRTKWMANDTNLSGAMDEYGFWQREVMRYCQMIQTAVSINMIIRARRGGQ